VSDVLTELRRCGAFNALDVEFARAMCRLVDEHDGAVLLGAALASRQTRAGHVCANLARFAGGV
jgi:hypothetical protein